MPTATAFSVCIEIGGMAVCLRTESAEFRRMLEERYAGFVSSRRDAEYELDVELESPAGGDEDVRVRRDGERWVMTRGDFRAEWDPKTRRGHIRQSANPYAVDSVLRILHTLLLAEQGGFLVHAASAIRNGKAFVFAGRSGAGKTTLSRLAPRDATLLTDEVSYVRKEKGYVAYGTPFAGELARVGENRAAPLSVFYLLSQGAEHRVEEVGAAEAVRSVMQNILFFTEDRGLVDRVFQSACEFVARVPVRRLTFAKQESVWELVG